MIDFNDRPLVFQVEVMFEPTSELAGEHAGVGLARLNLGLVNDGPQGKREGVFHGVVCGGLTGEVDGEARFLPWRYGLVTY